MSIPSAAILARDLMVRNLVTLSPHLDVFSAIDILLQRRISGAPVIETDGTFLGVFSEKSALQFIVNAAYENLPDAGLIPFVDAFPPTIEPETDFLTICQTFLNQATRRLPVVEDGKLLGQISRCDVMRKVRDLIKTKSSAGAQLLYLSALVSVEEARVRM